MSEQKKEDAAIDRKRKIDKAMEQAAKSKQTHLAEISRFDDILAAIKQDPEWKWPPSHVSYSEGSIVWSTPRMEDIKVSIGLLGAIVVLSETLDQFGSVAEALARVDQLLQIRELPRVRETVRSLDELYLPDDSRLLWRHLYQWVFAFPTFRLGDGSRDWLRVTLYNQQYEIKIERENQTKVWLPAEMIHLVPFPKP